jgi:hypothetical protein
MYHTITEDTQGSIERKAFNEHYGGYIEMIYLITNGDFTKMDLILEWNTERFLFQAEYLIRKRIVEQMR